MAGTATKTLCTICNLMLNSFDQFAAHKSGRSHKRREEMAATNKTNAAGSVQPPSAPVTKIVRPNTFIKFVSSQNNNGAASSQNVQNEGGTCGDTKIVESAQSETNVSVSQNDGTFCLTCKVKLTSHAQAAMHYAGLKHKRAVALAVSGTSGEVKGEGVKRKMEEICDVCNVPLITKVVAEAHYAGAKHVKKLKLSQNIGPANTSQPYSSFPGNSSGASNPSQNVQPGKLFFCNYCKVTVNSQMQLDAHQQGAKHKSAVSGIVQQRKKTFKPRQPLEQTRFVKPPEPPNRPYVKPPEPNRPYVKPPEQARFQEQTRYQEHTRFQEQSRYVNPSHFQAGNYGNPTGPMQFRPGVPVAYPTPYY